ncbi:ABC transporter permease [Streptococcus pneumoniae]|nr:ABC transporter permease [Streptococcus pneumoniae]
MIKRKTYWKDLIQSFTGSKGRFLSILILMMLGSLALVGLKVTSPNMEATANAYLTTAQTLDLAVMSNYGLDQADQEELKQTEGAEVEFGYLTDVTMDNGQDAIRLYSKPERISTFQLRKGRLPQSDKEIALTTHLQGQYSVGQEISFKEKEEGHSSLKDHTYTITGFVDSAEILSQRDMGYAGSGSGTLTAYGVILPSQFDQKVYNIARLKYQDLAGLNAFSSAYEEKSKQHQEELEQILSDNGKVRLRLLKKEGQESLDKGQETLDKAQTNLQEGKRRLAAAQARIQAQESQLALFPQAQREQASAQLTQAKQELGKEEDKLKQAEQNLAQEKEKLEKHQQVLDDLAEPRYQVYNRQTMPGGQGYLMYSNERTHAGIFKALGYRSKDIIAKFLLYGLVAGTVGTALGSILGHYLLASVISSVITKGMVVGETQIQFYWTYSLLAFVLSLLASVLPAYLVAWRELHDEAAQLLLPKPPVKGAKILLERIGFIWRRLSFTHKVTARNIFRYKQRMLMTIFGVAGSVALLFAGLGIQSSVAGVPSKQFQQIQQYQMLVSENPSATNQDKVELAEVLKGQEILAYQKIYSKALYKDFKGKAGLQNITLMMIEKEDLTPFIHLQHHQQELTLKDGIVITAKLAQLAGVKVGQTLEIEGKELKVVAITENYVGHFIYMSQASYEQLYGQLPQANTYLVSLRDTSATSIESQAGLLMNQSAVSSVVQNASAIRLFDSIASSLNQTMTILVIVSVLLAIVILYNLTNINVAERIRELSTIKVLGFHNNEVTLYIYRETIVLSLVGIVLGLIAGFYLHQFLIQMISPATILFYPQVGWEVYVIPVAAVSIILTLLGFFVNYYLRKVDMLEALKSVE